MTSQRRRIIDGVDVNIHPAAVRMALPIVNSVAEEIRAIEIGFRGIANLLAR